MLNVEAPVLVSVSCNVCVGCGWRELIFKLLNCRAAGISLTVPAVNVMVALADFVVSVADVALIVTVVLPAGTVAGAA
jgi:energy-converting hydrogenase Eha subunit E